ncbi:amidohydrolase [Phlyctema vagabunda]|uniref:Amidohydrolase n=1 Tax=Phlyctema vagabunda TaxID=108571 RepID=A0ABR4P7P2_9HELO
MRAKASVASEQNPLSIRPLALGTQSEKHGIKAALLIPGRGEPLKDAAVIVDGDKIAWVGNAVDVPANFKSVPFIDVPVLMPGMWDCHVHFMGTPAGATGYSSFLGVPGPLAGARTVRDLERTLLAGFTSVRELAGYGGEVSPAIDDGTIVGPNVYSSIAPLSMTAGHGDMHDIPIGAVLDAAAHGLTFAVCDGVPECIKAVRLMIRRGAKVIKVCASGGVGSELDDPEDRQFSDEELKAIVDEAGRSQRVVAAHCHGKEGIMAALRAGVKTIEHGSYLDEECAALMKEKNAILVATRLIVAVGVKEKDKWPPNSYKKLLALADNHKKAYALAVKSGVRIALGTDQGESQPGSGLTHGRNGKELYFAVEAGLTPLQAIEACTATSPETVGSRMAPRSGQLKEGYDADLIAVAVNPLQDIKLMSEPDNITHVWKGGKLFKSP